MRPSPSPVRRRILSVVVALLAIYLLLLIPAPAPELPPLPEKQPFLWNQDDYWASLGAEFERLRALPRDSVAALARTELSALDSLVTTLDSTAAAPGDSILMRIEHTIFQLGPDLAIVPELLLDHLSLFTRFRRSIKQQSQQWDMSQPVTRHQLYRLLYGSRAMIEEVLLQMPPDQVPSLIRGFEEPSITPAADLLGVTIHSGDLLVSRGGAPTSALIARGSDFPGNFSHVALVHVDETTHEASIIEAHIEIGVAIADIDRYLKDKKLRVMVLRPRADLLRQHHNPLLPHRAAAASRNRAVTEHIAYDFAMDYEDDRKLFCSEVASSVYRDQGMTLWMGISSISTPGVASWLAAFGVRHFETQEPSDLEHDPQLTVVAEWRDPETLWKDHLDNAVIDVMLEGAEAGDRLTYDWYLLPFGRVLKAYSVVKNWFGGVGPIPEGMSAASALRNDAFSTRHAAIKSRTVELAGQFESTKGYRPPYWELVALARQAQADVD